MGPERHKCPECGVRHRKGKPHLDKVARAKKAAQARWGKREPKENQ